MGPEGLRSGLAVFCFAFGAGGCGGGETDGAGPITPWVTELSRPGSEAALDVAVASDGATLWSDSVGYLGGAALDPGRAEVVLATSAFAGGDLLGQPTTSEGAADVATVRVGTADGAFRALSVIPSPLDCDLGAAAAVDDAGEVVAGSVAKSTSPDPGDMCLAAGTDIVVARIVR